MDLSCKHLSTALTGLLPSAVSESEGSESFPVQRVPWDFEFPFGVLTHVMNYLLGSLRCQAIDSVKVEPSEGHGQYHLRVAKLQILIIRLCGKVVPLSHQRGPAPHIQCFVFLIKLGVLSSTASVREGSVLGHKNG